MIKSIRGSDPDAAIYWMARMLAAGEEPRFVARRLVIAASEDIGNADPQGLILAQSAAAATEFIGMPECRIILAQAVTYLAAQLQNRMPPIQAIDAAMDDVRKRIGCCPFRCTFAIGTTRGLRGWGMATAMNTRTTRPKGGCLRIISESIDAITNRSIAAPKRNDETSGLGELRQLPEKTSSSADVPKE